MTRLRCITNGEPELRSCEIPGSHEASCNGWEYRWSNKDQDDMPTGRECTGCEPRPAVHGLVCAGCYGRIREAVGELPAFARATAGIERVITPEGGGQSSALGFVPLTALGMDFDAIDRFMLSYWRCGSNIDVWVSSYEGAHDAVRAAQAIKGAIFRHPVKVTQEHIDKTPCFDCHMLSLVRIPPATHKADEKIVCRSATCKREYTDAERDLIIGIENGLGEDMGDSDT